MGASLAGARAVSTLREEGFDDELVLIGEEPYLPYDRPPLSKQYLRDDWSEDRLGILGEEDIARLNVRVELGDRADALDLSGRELVLSSGARLRVDGLIVATGVRAARLPLLDAKRGVYYLRSVDDSRGLRAAIAGATRMTVVGGGFIGSEIAATARARGVDVTLIEAGAAPLAGPLGTQVADRLADLHREHGVRLKCHTTIERCESAGNVKNLVLTDGTRVEAEIVVVGVGTRPNTEWLESSGLNLADGVVCDARCRTSVGSVVAAGDVARWYDVRRDSHVRVEHWTNASEQGSYAARSLLRRDRCIEPFRTLPFFWTELHGKRIQLLGDTRDSDDMVVVHGSLSADEFVALYGRQGRVIGAVGCAAGRILGRYRDVVERQADWDEARELLGQTPAAGGSQALTNTRMNKSTLGFGFR